MCIGNKVNKIKIIHRESFLSIIAVIAKNSIPMIMFCVKNLRVSKVKILIKVGVTSIRANQAAERFPVTADSAFNSAWRVSFVTSIF